MANLRKAGKIIRVKSVVVAGPGKITGRVTIPANTRTGKWTVNVTNPDGPVRTTRESVVKA